MFCFCNYTSMCMCSERSTRGEKGASIGEKGVSIGEKEVSIELRYRLSERNGKDNISNTEKRKQQQKKQKQQENTTA